MKSSHLVPENCSATVSIDQPLSQLVTFYVPSGTVCLECIIDGVLATDASFLILNSPVSPSEGTVVNGTLVVFVRWLVRAIWCSYNRASTSIALPLPSTFHFHRASTSIDLPLPSRFHFHRVNTSILRTW